MQCAEIVETIKEVLAPDSESDKYNEQSVGTAHYGQKRPSCVPPTQAVHLTRALATRAAQQLRNSPLT